MLRAVYVAVWLTAVLMMHCVQCIQVAKIEKRSYNPWLLPSYNALSVYNAGKVFRPATNTITPPYYIPVYGSGGNYIFYPPQPLYTNPGVPVDNPDKIPFKGEPYLPPKPNKEVPTNTRFGADDDDGPVWGKETDQTTKTAPTNTGNRLDGDDDAPIWSSSPVHLSKTDELESKPQQSSRPTRPPAAAIQPPRPPLVHDQSPSQPPPPEVADTPLPPEMLQSSPSNCVWAIISCCSATSPVPPQNCFEQRGCPGPFWGNSPCHSDFARTAIALAVEYYNRNPAG